jgi:PAS domain S-box-containing protein
VCRGSDDIERDGLAAAMEQTADGVVITDSIGTIQYVNAAFTTMTGYTREEAVGNNPRVLKSGRHAVTFYEELWKTIQCGRVWNGEVINRRKDGTSYEEEMRITPVLGTNGEIVRYIAIKHDVTGQRAAEKAHRCLAAIVENSEDAIISSTPTGVILTWNRGAEAIFGYTSGEAVGKPVSMLMAPDRMPDIVYFTERVSHGIVVSQYESLCLSKDGREICVSVTGSPIITSSGEVVALSAVLRDISERIAAEHGQALLASIVESSDDAIHSTSLDGTIVSWNQGAAAMFGYLSQEIIGKSVAILAPPSRTDEVRNYLLAVAKGCTVSPFDTVLQGKNGLEIDVSLSVSPIRNQAGGVVGIAGIARDIRKRQLAEQKLHESEALFRAGFEYAPYGMCVVGMDGNFIQVNGALCRMLGYSSDELLNTPWGALIHPEGLAPCLQKMEQLLAADSGGVVGADRRYIHRNGSVVLGRVRVSLVRGHADRPQCFVAHVEDITESKRAEQALRESDERFRVMADGCPAVMWVTNAEGEIQFINRAFREFLGTSYEQMEGRKWELALHPEDAAEYVGALQRAVREHASFSAEVRVRRADGEWRWMASSAEPRLSADGEFLGHVGLSPDITERKRAQEEQYESEQRFRIMADGCPAMMWVTDTKGEPQFINRAHREFCGTQSEENEAGKWQALIHPDDAPAYVELVQHGQGGRGRRALPARRWRVAMARLVRGTALFAGWRVPGTCWSQPRHHRKQAG